MPFSHLLMSLQFSANSLLTFSLQTSNRAINFSIYKSSIGFLHIQSLAQERNYGPNRGKDTEKERGAAKQNLSRAIQDYHGRFSSFAPKADTTYGLEVDRVINTIVPVWIQMRETFVPLRPKKEDVPR